MPSENLADILNRSCHCIGVDADALRDSLASRFGKPDAYERLLETHPHLLAESPVFVGREHIDAMQEIIGAIEQVVALPGYRDRILGAAPAIARIDNHPGGVFFGYDFHLTTEGPRLIEINTNAGGALLLLYLASAQQACCSEVEPFIVAPGSPAGLERQFVEMFREELAAASPGRDLRRIAIVDETPEAQYLLPEFELFRALFAEHGIDAVIASPADLQLQADSLLHRGNVVDVVYNRLTDFYLQSDASATLSEAFTNGAAVFTPGPRAHALYADKRNLALLCDPEALHTLGAAEDAKRILGTAIPRTVTVGDDNADDLWARRRQLYFKPARGFGSRGTYRGAKLTRKTWSSILEHDYVAQEQVRPSERTVVTGGESRTMKVDIRCYVYRGEIQLLGARMYRGQTTNFRTYAGGLAAVFTTPDVRVS